MNVVASVRSARSGRCRTDKSQSVKTPHLAVCRVVYHIRKTWIAMFYTHSPKVGTPYKWEKVGYFLGGTSGQLTFRDFHPSPD